METPVTELKPVMALLENALQGFLWSVAMMTPVQRIPAMVVSVFTRPFQIAA
jgi:hypothetical protein